MAKQASLTKTSEKKVIGSVSAKPKENTSQTMNSPVEQILHLQRTIGNQAVQRLLKSGKIQAKLKIGKPHDKYEMEADRIADKVMSMPEQEGSLGKSEKESSLVNSHSSFTQRKSRCPECPDKEGIQTKPLADQITPLVQRQVDEEEEPVQTKLLQRQETEEEEEPVQTKRIQRQEAEEEEDPVQTKLQRQAEEEEEEPVQTKQASNQTPAVNSNIESSVNSLKGRGQPLPESTRSYFEPRFGTDFSQVRVHTDSQAAETTKSINAKAFTTGSDVVFGAGEYSPGTSSGKRLLAHELTHVVQQKSAVRYPVHSQYDSTIISEWKRNQVELSKVEQYIQLETIADVSRIVVNDLDKKKSRIISIDDKEFSQNYIDNNIVSANYWIAPSSFVKKEKKLGDFWVNYSDGRRLKFSLEKIPVRIQRKLVPGQRPPVYYKPRRYIKKGGFIYPLFYSDGTVPRLVDVATTIAINQMRREKFREIAELTFIFAITLSEYTPLPKSIPKSIGPRRFRPGKKGGRPETPPKTTKGKKGTCKLSTKKGLEKLGPKATEEAFEKASKKAPQVIKEVPAKKAAVPPKTSPSRQPKPAPTKPQVGVISQKAKRRLAKKAGGVPRSAQPIRQGRYGKGTKWWEYKDSNGKIKIVVKHPDGSVHVGTPKPQSRHLQGGPPKYYPVPGTGHIGE